MDKKSLQYPHNGMLSDHKNEWSAATCYNLDKPWKHYANEEDSHKRLNITLFNLHKFSRLGKFIEKKCRLMVG